MNVFEILVNLKKSEKALASEIKDAQSQAMIEAEKLGKTGKIGTWDGGSIVFKYVPVRAKPTEQIKEKQTRINEIFTSLATLNEARISELKAEIATLQTNSEVVQLEKEVADLTALLPQENAPQISVTLSK